MALEVGELVSYLRMDDTDFQRKLSKGGTDLQRFGQGAMRALQPIATGFAAGTTAATGLVAAVFAQGVAYNTLQQSSRAALTTILGGAEAANAQMDKLDEFARTSPFAKQVFIQAQQQLLGFGVAAEDVIPALSAIQDSVAAIGGSNEDVSNITNALAQMQGQGKLTGETLNQLGQYGIDAATILGESMGKTGQEIRDMASKPGGIPVDQVWDPLVSSLTEKFGGAAENVKNTWVGATDRIKGATRDIGSALAQPFVDPNGGGKALDWANAFADLLRAVERQAGPLIEVLLPKLLPLADGITNRLLDAADAVDSLDMDQLIAQLGGVGEYAAPLAAVAAALFAMGTQAAPIAALGLSLNPVAAALVAIIAASPDARGAVMEFLGSFSELRDEAGELVLALGDLGNVLIDGLVQILSTVTGTAQESGGAIDLLALGIDSLTSAVQLVTGIAGPLVDFLAGLIDAASGAEGPILAIVAAMVAMRAVDVGGVISKLTGALDAGKQTWGASQATLEALGREAGLMNTSMMTARAGVTRLGGALKGLLIANAPMLAIAALAGVIGHYMQEAAEAKALTDDLASSFDELTGAATAETDRMILDQLNESLTAGQWDILKDLGYDYMDVIAAIKAGGPELEALEVQLDRTTQAGKQRSIQTGETIDVTEAEAEASRRLKGELEELGPAYEGAAAKGEMAAEYNNRVTDSLIEASDEANGTTTALQTFEDALATLSDEASSAEERLSALNDILDIMSGGVPTVTEATIKHADAVRKAADAAAGFAFSQEDLNSILADDGSLNLQSEAVSGLRGEMESMVGTAQRQADALILAGDTEGAVRAYEELDEQLRIFAEQAGVKSPEAVDALIDSLGLLPPEVMVDFQTNGTDAAVENIDMVKQHITDLPDSVLTYINGNTAGIETAVDETGLRMAYVASMSADPNIGANDTENLNIVAAAVARLNEIDGMEPTPELNAEKKALERVVSGAKIDLDSVPDKDVEVTATTYGFGSVDALKSAIDRVKSKTVYVNAYTRNHGKVNGEYKGMGYQYGNNGMLFDSPTVRRYADGGVEHRVAQIAPAGAWRVWAEEETGGEAYVPLAAHKRARSLAIMHDVASRFGHVMVPVQAQRYADGGTTAVAAARQVSAGTGIDYGRLEAAVAGGAERGTSRATVAMSDRAAASSYQRGRSGSRDRGGPW